MYYLDEKYALLVKRNIDMKMTGWHYDRLEMRFYMSLYHNFLLLSWCFVPFSTVNKYKHDIAGYVPICDQFLITSE